MARSASAPDATAATASTPEPEAATDPNRSRQLFFATFPSIMLPMFLAAIDQTIVATALPSIAGQMGELSRIAWIVIGYLLATTIAAPVYGRLGDALGRKRMMFVALAIFIVASLLCAAAPTVTLLAAARVLQGAGGGGLMTLSQALIGEAVPPRERARYQGWLGSIFAFSSTFGPVVGGWLTQHWGWRSVFMINLPMGLVAMALVTRLPSAAAAPSGRFRFDTPGAVLFALFITPLLLGLEQAQRMDAASLTLAAGLAAFAAAALTLLLRHERRTPQPLLPVSLLRHPTIWRADAMAMCNGANVVSLVTFLPIYLRVVRGLDASSTGLMLLPLTALIAVGSMITGRLMARTGRTAIIPSIGLPLAALGLVFMAFAAPDLTLRQLPFLFAWLSLFSGTTMSVVQLTVQLVAGRAQLGAAAASVQFSRSVGAALGAAITGAVLFAMIAMSDPGTAHLFAHVVEAGPSALSGLPPERLATVKAEIAAAFRAAFLTIACFPLTGAILAWTLPLRRLDAD
ncbi:MAG: MFS transporter [Rhodospirillales bacterium]|nr:MFS transporter [Rhodospirillales bacterium]